ncbi:MAG: mycothiol synthase [Acidimicrobiia bacterium]
MELRPVEATDRESLDAMFELAAECDGHFPIGEHKYLDLMGGDGDAAGQVGVVDGTPVAYLAVTPPRRNGTAALEIAVHPLHRSHGVIERLIKTGVEAAAATGAATVRVWVFQPNMVDELRAAGFRGERELRQLRIDLPVREAATIPAGLVERPFRPGTDDDAWLAVNNAAFRGHPENGSWTPEILADRFSQPWFDPAGFVTVWSGDELAGFCWTKPHAEMGEIYVIAVAPAYQGRGLGRVLVIRGLEVINDRYGFEVGMLYMDADNTAAAALYESLGFRLHHVDRSLVRTL